MSAAEPRPPKPAPPRPIDPRATPLAPFTTPEHRRWVGWRYEWRPGKKGKPGKWTKPPRSANGHYARNDDPSTWSSFDEIWPLVTAGRFDGIGFELKDLPGTAAIDLDNVRDPSTGAVLPWAAALIAEANSFTEITPSQCGYRVIGNSSDLPVIHRKKDHPEGGSFELYVGATRYITVSGHRLDGAPRALNDITGAVTKLLAIADAKPGRSSPGSEQPEPHPAGPDPEPPEPPDGTAAPIDLQDINPLIAELVTRGTQDGQPIKHRGKMFFQVVRYLHSKGYPYAAVLATLLAHPDGVHAKFGARLGAELYRAWGKLGEADPVTALLIEFNGKFIVVNENGKPCIYLPRLEPDLNRWTYDRMTIGGLSLLYANRLVQVGEKENGAPKYAKAADVWLSHPARRQFIKGVTFDPANRNSDPQVLNLWRGFAIEPKPGSWGKLQEHILTNICDTDTTLYDYLINLMADMTQRPAKQGEVAIVLRGPEGCGKGTLAKALLRLFGQHGFAISNATHLTGRFNGHLRDCVLLFADEAFYAGDKQHVGVLKSLITEPYLTVEAKYANAIQAPNYLHVILASNEDWVIPASLRSRRWLVFDVSDARAGDHAYFAAIYRELEQGGYAAMLHDLLNHPLSEADLRAVPTTEALQEQRKRSVDTVTAWWLDCLHRGWVFESRLGLENHWQKWHDFLPTEALYTSFTRYAEAHRERHPLSRELFGRWMRESGAKPQKRHNQAVGEHIVDSWDAGTQRPMGRIAELIMHERATGYEIGPLAFARAAFEETTKLTVEWERNDAAP